MSTLPVGLIIEALVAVLLLITIGFCVALNRRIGMLRSDEHMLRTTIADLNASTARAEAAISNLRSITGETDQVLGERMAEVQGLLQDLEREVVDGEAVLSRISAITSAAGRAQPKTMPAQGGPAARLAAIRKERAA